MNNDPRQIMPGTRVLVFDYTIFKDDVKTPLSQTLKKATVVCRYGSLKETYSISGTTLGPYPDLVDVVFDHRPERVSHGHFTSGVEIICSCKASTGICGCITRGTGRLSDNGYWEVECTHGNAYTPYECNCQFHGKIKFLKWGTDLHLNLMQVERVNEGIRNSTRH